MSTQLQHRGGKKQTKKCCSVCVLMGILKQLETFTHVKSNNEKKRNSTEGLFFSINNSFWHIREEVKLDIPEEHSLQQRMTRNNEDILPQTLSPAEWRHKSTKKKLRSCCIFDLSKKKKKLSSLFSINIYCKAPLRITYKTVFGSIKK